MHDGVTRRCQDGVARMLGTFCSTHDLIPASAGCARFLRRYACIRRDMNEVLRLAIPLVEPSENSEDLGGALRAEDCIGLGEGGHIEAGVLLSPAVGRNGREDAARLPPAP